jgi:hypothetical protein
MTVPEPKRFARCRFDDMRRTTLLAVALVALAVPLAARAKGPDRASVCGTDRCTSFRGSEVNSLLDWGRGSGIAQLPAPSRAPFYRLTLYEGGRPTWQIVYAPSVERGRITQLDVYPYRSVAPYWRRVTPDGRAALSRVTRGLQPFPAPSAWR